MVGSKNWWRFVKGKRKGWKACCWFCCDVKFLNWCIEEKELLEMKEGLKFWWRWWWIDVYGVRKNIMVMDVLVVEDGFDIEAHCILDMDDEN